MVIVEFLRKDKQGGYSVPCGTDHYLILDGRKKLSNLIKDIKAIPRSKNYNGFIIRKDLNFKACISSNINNIIYSTVNCKKLNYI